MLWNERARHWWMMRIALFCWLYFYASLYICKKAKKYNHFMSNNRYLLCKRTITWITLEEKIYLQYLRYVVRHRSTARALSFVCKPCQILCNFVMRLLIFFKDRRLCFVHLSVFLYFCLHPSRPLNISLSRSKLRSWPHTYRVRRTRATSRIIEYAAPDDIVRPTVACAKLTSKFSVISTYSVIVLIFPTVCKFACYDVSTCEREILRSLCFWYL